MSEWLSGNLGDIADIVMGQSPTGESVNTNGLGVPLLNGPTEFTIRYPKAVQFSTDPKRFSKVNDILFCVRGSTTGRMNWADEDYAIGRGLAAIRHKQGEEYRYFVKAILDYYLDTMLASASGSTFPNVSKDQLNELEISYPSFPEQKAIASILSSLDDKIDLLHRQNKTLEAMAETLFRQWFIEEAKEDWGEIPFGDLIELHDSKRIPLSQLQRDERRLGALYPYYGASGIIDQINEYIFDGDYLLLSEDGENLRTRKTPIAFEAKGKFWVNNHAHVMQAKSPFTNGFLRILLESENLDSIITGAVQPKINQANLVSYKIPNFPHELVIKYVGLSTPWFCKVHSNTKQIQTLENLRDTLLPKLMSGEVRVQYQTEEVA